MVFRECSLPKEYRAFRVKKRPFSAYSARFRTRIKGLTEASPHAQDYLRFEGNAQALRLLTRLQVRDDRFGLDLTCAALAILLKYPVPSDEVDPAGPQSSRKFGYFQSERDIVEEVWGQTGLSKGQRHPLAYVVEAADDISYSILDAEDAVRKRLVSFNDVLAFLSQRSSEDALIEDVCTRASDDHKEYRRLALSPQELSVLSMEKLRVYCFDAMVPAVVRAFLDSKDAILDGTFHQSLVKHSAASHLCRALKDFDSSHVYEAREVLEIELRGHRAIPRILDYLWTALENVPAGDPRDRYVMNRISENYRRVHTQRSGPDLPDVYRNLQLVCDMVSGMTDSFALSFLSELEDHVGEPQ
jgi:dGTPase